MFIRSTFAIALAAAVIMAGPGCGESDTVPNGDSVGLVDRTASSAVVAAAPAAKQRAYVKTAPWLPTDVSAPFMRIAGLGLIVRNCSADDHPSITLRLGKNTTTSTIVVRPDEGAPTSALVDPGEEFSVENDGEPSLIQSWIVTPAGKGDQRVFLIDVAGGRSLESNPGCGLSVVVREVRQG
jgi:hypothetical protein